MKNYEKTMAHPFKFNFIKSSVQEYELLRWTQELLAPLKRNKYHSEMNFSAKQSKILITTQLVN